SNVNTARRSALGSGIIKIPSPVCGRAVGVRAEGENETFIATSPLPPREIRRRDARNFYTCRSSRTPATAARRRRGAHGVLHVLRVAHGQYAGERGFDARRIAADQHDGARAPGAHIAQLAEVG